MRRLLLIAAGVLVLVLFVSGAFFEWIWLEQLAEGSGPLEARLEDAFLISSAFDVVLVGLAAVAVTWPFYRRIRHLQEVAQQQRSGDLQARASLEGSDILAELGAAFDALADANAQHLDNQRALLRAVSHELRTPVARLRFALAELVAADKGEARSLVRERAEADIEELDALIDEVLAYVRVGPGGAPREPRPFQLADVLRAIVDEYQNTNTQVLLEVPDELELVGEPHLVKRAVSNLVRNAVAHAQSTVWLRATSGHRVEITVRDDGPGLPADANDEIFLPFVRHDEMPGGTGLGLSIAHAIARRHGGDLDFTRRPPGTGAEFRLALPADRGSQWAVSRVEPGRVAGDGAGLDSGGPRAP